MSDTTRPDSTTAAPDHAGESTMPSNVFSEENHQAQPAIPQHSLDNTTTTTTAAAAAAAAVATDPVAPAFETTVATTLPTASVMSNTTSADHAAGLGGELQALRLHPASQTEVGGLVQTPGTHISALAQPDSNAPVQQLHPLQPLPQHQHRNPSASHPPCQPTTDATTPSLPVAHAEPAATGVFCDTAPSATIETPISSPPQLEPPRLTAEQPQKSTHHQDPTVQSLRGNAVTPSPSSDPYLPLSRAASSATNAPLPGTAQPHIMKAASMPPTMFSGVQADPSQRPSTASSRGKRESVALSYAHASPSAATSFDATLRPQSISSSGPNASSSFGSLRQGSSAATDDGVLARSSVPYSEIFPIKDKQVGPHHFRRLKLLGRGGIGHVYLVQLKGTDLLYAMKVLTKEEMIQRNKVKRVMTEREILATANHPFVVTMYASFQTHDSLCFVMEYCAGGEFFKVLQRQPQRRLREDAVRFYAAEVLLALEYLHHMGFIYRDLKPENILLRANGHIALTDFDLSKQAHAVSPRVVEQHLSMSDKIKKSLSMKRSGSGLNNLEIVDSEPILPYHTNSFVGTEDYISPEIINGVGQSSAVDWWTFGILIYEMLTGTTPFKGSHADETFSNIVNHQVRWPEDVAVSADCKHLVKRLLRREPDKRLGSVNGASDIKRAKWFTGFNFALVRNATPPIIPRPSNQLETLANQGEESTEPEMQESGDYESKNPDDPFKDFNIRRDSEFVKY